MPTPDETVLQGEQGLDDHIAAYLETSRCDTTTDRKHWVDDHPDFADDLIRFFACRDHFEKLAGPLRRLLVPDTPRHLPEPFGDYVLLEELGRGGMGVVYRARQQSLHRDVAIKLILSGEFASHAERERFHREAEAAAQLDHPGIVPIYEVGEQGGRPFLSMGLVEGRSLATRLDETPWAPRAAAELMRQAADAMDYAHRRGVVHRDLKPANLLVDKDWRIRITDFGLAKCALNDSQLTKSGEILGTPAYMAPEQVDHTRGDVGPRTDVHALGAILYALLTGHSPHQAATVPDTLRQVCESDPVSISRLNSGVPRDLGTICLKCLEKDPQQRYGSAAELSEELQRFLAGKPIIARPISPPARVWRWCQRQPVVAGLLATVVVTLIAGTAISTHLALAESQHAQREADARKEAQEREQIARRRLYSADINVAQNAWSVANVRRVLQILERHQPEPGYEDLRGFEWYYLWRLCHQDRRTIRCHESEVESMAVSPDSRMLATVASGEPVRIWDLESGRQLHELATSGPNLHCVDFSPDGRWLAAGGENNSVVVWRCETWEHHARFQVETPPEPDRAPGSPGSSDSSAAEDPVIEFVCFAPDSSTLATGGLDGTVGLCDLQSGAARPFKRHTAAISALRYAHDGGWLAIGTTHAVQGWDVTSGKTVVDVRASASDVQAIDISPDGGLLAWADLVEHVHLFDVRTGEERALLAGHRDRILDLSFSPDGTRLASANRDNTIKLWDVASLTEVETLQGHLGAVSSVAFTRDGRTLASGSTDGTVKLWDLAVTGRRQLFRAGPEDKTSRIPYGIALAPDDRTLFWGNARRGGCVSVWDLVDGRELSIMEPHGFLLTEAVALSPDGALLATGEFGNNIQLYDVATGKVLAVFQGHEDRTVDVAFSSDGRSVVSASWDGTIRIWDVGTRSERLTIQAHPGGVGTVRCSPRGEIVSTGEDNFVRVWYVQSGQLQRELDVSDQAPWAAIFSPDGRWLAVGFEEGLAEVWETATWQRTAILQGHSGPLRCLAFSPDGKRLATGSFDRTIMLWDVARGEERAVLRGHMAHIIGLLFSRDGQTLLSSANDHTVRIWRAATEDEVRTRMAESSTDQRSP